jgi:hypothetical protein
MDDQKEPESTRGAILEAMDRLAEDDIAASRRTSPAEKLAQAIDVMETGSRLKRAALRAPLPDATEREIDAAFERWLFDDA